LVTDPRRVVCQGNTSGRQVKFGIAVPVGDFVFPLIFSPNTPDRLARVVDIEGPSVEYHLFRSGTGTDWSEEEFERAAARIYTLERAVTVRHWGRDRKMDEMVLPSFEYPENWTNPLVGERQALDRDQFMPVMDEYYGHLGWDSVSGWPMEARLTELGLNDVHGPMIRGAEEARCRLAGPMPEKLESSDRSSQGGY